MKKFQEIQSLPRHLSKLCEKFELAEDLFNELMCKTAVFHKSCSNLYNKQKLCRKRKTKEKDEEEKIQNVNEKNQSISEKRKKRKSQPNSSNSQICFFCTEIEENEENLHQCQTFSLNDKIRRIASDLADYELLAKLSGGDMIATEAKYHLKCLTDLYNRHRSFQKKFN